MSPLPSDAELASRARGTDRGAFDQLVARHKAMIYRLVRGYLGNSDDAYDVVQDTFVSAWLALKHYDTTKDFATWLRTIALNKCRDFSRRQTVRRRFLRLFAMEQATLPSHYERGANAAQDEREAQRLARMEQAIAELPAFYKEPLLLTTLGGLSQQGAAEHLKTTAKAIEMRVRRAKKRLAEMLGEAAEG